MTRLPHAHRTTAGAARLTVAGEKLTPAELVLAIACGLAGVVFFWIVYIVVVAAFGP